MSKVSIPELGFFGGNGTIRVPELRNVGFTNRTQEIVDHPAFQRLRKIRQLGSTHLVYPGATHSRFEHSIGVFGCVQWYLQSLLQVPAFGDSATEEDILTVLAAGLLHDIGHYPFAHNLEALHLKGRDTPKHEEVGSMLIRGEVKHLAGPKSIAAILKGAWKLDPQRVIDICLGQIDPNRQMDSVLNSIISSAIDADKMDYLERDSIHMGVPYGRNYDRDRLLSSLTLNENETKIAIKAKGKVSAEIFIFGRYTMFSEAYWHHTVRSASAMIEASLSAFYSRDEIGASELLETLLSHTDDTFLEWLYDSTQEKSGTRYLLHGLIRNQRKLYKRIATFSRVYKEPAKQRAYQTIYSMDGDEIYALTDRLRARLSTLVGRPLHPADIIIDTPPRDKDKLETIDVVYNQPTGDNFYKLHELSRVVAGIQDDFMMVVKKIRIFAEPKLAAELKTHGDLSDIIIDEIG